MLPGRRVLLSAVGAAFLLLGSMHGPAYAGATDGGLINAPGERSHNVYLGWPEAVYLWEGLVKKGKAFGLRVGVQIWPLAITTGLNMRFTLLERDRVSLALLLTVLAVRALPFLPTVTGPLPGSNRA